MSFQKFLRIAQNILKTLQPKPASTCFNLLTANQTCSYLLQPTSTYSNLLQHTPTCYLLIKYVYNEHTLSTNGPNLILEWYSISITTFTCISSVHPGMH